MNVPNENLQRARLEKHWSVAVASTRAGVSVNTFNRWERGLQIPQLGTLDQLCAAFEMSAEDLGFGNVVLPRKKTELFPMVERETRSCAAPMPGLLPGAEARPLVLNPVIRQPQVPYTEPAAPSSLFTDFSRRRAIAALISTPASVFSSGHEENFSALRAEEVLALCTTYIPLCWQLYFEGGLIEVEQVLPAYINQLSILTGSSPSCQRRAASLLSQAYLLASLLAMHHQNYGRAGGYAQQGQFYGELAEDINLQVASLIRLAMISFFLKRVHPCLLIYQKALRLTSQASPLLQGRVYAGLTEAYSYLGQEEDAWHFLDLAVGLFPQNVEDDPGYAYTNFRLASISIYEGLVHFNLGRFEEALTAFSRVDRTISLDAVPDRLRLLIRQAAVSYAQGNLERTARLIEVIVPMARRLDSQLRADQAYEIYERMLHTWGSERIVKDLEELFIEIAPTDSSYPGFASSGTPLRSPASPR